MKKVCLEIRSYIDNSPFYFMIFIVFCCFLNDALSIVLATHWGGVVMASCKWDCQWYMEIAKDGYSKGPLLYDSDRLTQANWAFFPLYPFLIRCAQIIFSSSAEISGLIVNFILWPVVVFLCYRDLELRKIRIDKVFFAILFALYPLNIWYSLQYSEAVYAVFLVGSLVALRCEKVELAAFLCFFLSLSRPTGFVMAIVIACWWCFKKLAKKRELKRKLDKNDFADSVLLVAAAGAGLSCFVFYLYWLVGDGFAFAHIQIAWDRKFDFFWKHFVEALKSSKDFGFIIYIVLLVIYIKRMLNPEWMLYAALVSVTMFLALSTSVVSIERYVFGNPLMIQFFAVSMLGGERKSTYKILTLFFLMHIFIVILWYRKNYLLI